MTTCMRKVLLAFIRYVLPVSIAMFLIAGTMALAVIVLGLVRYEETVLTWTLWSTVLAYTAVFLSAFAAMFVSCSACRKRAFVVPNPDGEPGNTIAIFETRACHHCGARL